MISILNTANYNSDKVMLSKNEEEKYAENITEVMVAFKDLKIHLKEQVVYRKEKLIHLSNQEFRLLQLLTEHPGWVCSKEEIYTYVWGENNVGDVDNIIYCLIYSLRKKLEIDPHHPKHIKTVRGAGYKFVIPEE